MSSPPSSVSMPMEIVRYIFVFVSSPTARILRKTVYYGHSCPMIRLRCSSYFIASSTLRREYRGIFRALDIIHQESLEYRKRRRLGIMGMHAHTDLEL